MYFFYSQKCGVYHNFFIIQINLDELFTSFFFFIIIFVALGQLQGIHNEHDDFWQTLTNNTTDIYESQTVTVKNFLTWQQIKTLQEKHGTKKEGSTFLLDECGVGIKGAIIPGLFQKATIFPLKRLYMQIPELLGALGADVKWDQVLYKWTWHKAKVRVVSAERERGALKFIGFQN